MANIFGSSHGRAAASRADQGVALPSSGAALRQAAPCSEKPQLNGMFCEAARRLAGAERGMGRIVSEGGALGPPLSRRDVDGICDISKKLAAKRENGSADVGETKKTSTGGRVR